MDLKPDKSQVIPTTIRDLWAILDYTTIMNRASGHTLSEMSTDDFFIDSSLLPRLSNPEQRNAYLWKSDLYEHKEGIGDWDNPYVVILHANIVLERLKYLGKDASNAEQWDNLYGSALFYRAWSFQTLSQSFCPTYNALTAATDLGIPLRLESDITNPSSRTSVEETYRRIEKDLLEASALLQDLPLVKTRPSKAAALALLSRLYLIMGNYEQSLDMASRCLAIYNELLDYNDLDSIDSYPFELFNDEVIFHTNMSIPAILGASRLYVSPLLYDSYGGHDLRKYLYFRPGSLGYHFKGSYNGSASFFTGLATDEIWLTKAEANARLGNYQQAVSDLNHILSHRYKRESNVPIETFDSHRILNSILLERRKDLVFRGIRWADLRRLNSERQFEQTLRKEVDGEEYVLPSGDPRYVFPIPNEVIRITGIQQNQR